MNIFVTSPCPKESAISLPDRHICKMPIETCQLLSIVASKKWGYNYGSLHKSDNTPYKTEKGAFRNHPCTKWIFESIDNASWLIEHGVHLCNEFELRYNKRHACLNALEEAYQIFPKGKIKEVTYFTRAMPDQWKMNKSIDTFEAYKRYISSKPWVKNNYLRITSRKPDWINYYGTN